jgi:hypothetical protein
LIVRRREKEADAAGAAGAPADPSTHQYVDCTGCNHREFRISDFGLSCRHATTLLAIVRETADWMAVSHAVGRAKPEDVLTELIHRSLGTQPGIGHTVA